MRLTGAKPKPTQKKKHSRTGEARMDKSAPSRVSVLIERKSRATNIPNACPRNKSERKCKQNQKSHPPLSSSQLILRSSVALESVRAQLCFATWLTTWLTSWIWSMTTLRMCLPPIRPPGSGVHDMAGWPPPGRGMAPRFVERSHVVPPRQPPPPTFPVPETAATTALLYSPPPICICICTQQLPVTVSAD